MEGWGWGGRLVLGWLYMGGGLGSRLTLPMCHQRVCFSQRKGVDGWGVYLVGATNIQLLPCPRRLYINPKRFSLQVYVLLVSITRC